MIDSIEEVLTGKERTVHGDLTVQLIGWGDSARLCLHQGTETVRLDGEQLAHLARLCQGLVGYSHQLAAQWVTLDDPPAGG